MSDTTPKASSANATPTESKNETNLCAFISFLFCSFVVIVLGIVSSLASSGYTPLYIITPSSCNTTLYAQKPSWYLNPWRLDLTHGLCPTGGVTKNYYRRLSEDQSDRKLTNWNYQFSSQTGYDYKSLLYANCVRYHRAPEWYAMDAANTANGYTTNLGHSQLFWYQSWQLGLAATIISWFVFGAMLFSGLNIPALKGGLGISLIVLPPFAFACWLACGATFTDSDQTDAKAYSTAMFKSCTVTVQQAGGYALVALSIICAGFVGLFFWVQAIMWLACSNEFTLDGLFETIIGAHWKALLDAFGSVCACCPTTHEPVPSSDVEMAGKTGASAGGAKS